jgi:hypothetical protein
MTSKEKSVVYSTSHIKIFYSKMKHEIEMLFLKTKWEEAMKKSRHPLGWNERGMSGKTPEEIYSNLLQHEK